MSKPPIKTGLRLSDSLPGNVFVDDGKGKFEVSAVTIFNRAFDDLAVDVEKVAEIGLIVFEVFDSMSAAVMCLYRLSRALSES